MKLLLHTCCGPCFLGVWEDLKNRDLEITNYFYNPNIQPQDEYDRRLEALQIAVSGKSDLIVADYLPQEHVKAISGYENDFPRRCSCCYELRLRQTAKYAANNGFDTFSTTLLVSPYQQHEILKEICEKLSKEFGVSFFYQDFRPHFRAGQSEARFIPIYRQKYCGCLLSLNESK